MDQQQKRKVYWQAKEYLARVETAEKELRDLQKRLEHYRLLGLQITPHMSDTPGSHKNAASRVETAAVESLDIVSMIQGKMRAYTVIIDEAEKLIDKIQQERYRRLLKLRYLAGLSLPSVGDELGYRDRNSIYRAHGWALLELEHILQEEGIGSNE